MKEEIRNNLENPEILENLYRGNRKAFESDFFEIFPEISGNPVAKFWYFRLKKEKGWVFDFKLQEVLFVLISCLTVSILILTPKLFGFNPEYYRFYERNLALIALLGVTQYSFFAKRIANLKKVLIIAGIFLLFAIYVNVLPLTSSSSVILVYLHLPILLWFLFGSVYINFDYIDYSKRIEFIRHNGELAILFGIFAIAGMLLTAFTINLFEAIGVKIEKFYIDFVVTPGIVSVPIICSYLTYKFDSLSNRITQIVANIFSPLFLLTLIVYLISITVKGSNPFIDRNFLIIFNAMLAGVVALIIFSISERENNTPNQYHTFIFTALLIIALVIDIIALSAIIFRITEYGITPNRLAVLGSNLLFLTHIALMLLYLLKVIQKKSNLNIVELATAKFLPIYGIWLVFVVFIIPLIFGFN